MIQKKLYDLLSPQFKSTVDQIRYRLKLLPRVDSSAAGQDWLPAVQSRSDHFG